MSYCGSKVEKEVGRRYFLKLFPVNVKYGNRIEKTYAFLDTGSGQTICDKELADRLGATGPKKVLNILTFSSDSPKKWTGMLISLSVTSLADGKEVELNDVLTKDTIPLSAIALPTAVEHERMQHLQGVELHELENKSVGLLIGVDNHSVFRHFDERHGKDGEPDAIQTVLGWTLFGVMVMTQAKERLHQRCAINPNLCESNPLEKIVQRYYYMIFPVKVKYGNKIATTNAILDSGSDRTYCKKQLAIQLGAIGSYEVLHVQTASLDSPTKLTGMLISLSVTSLASEKEVKLNDVLTKDTIPLSAIALPTVEERERMQHLQGVDLHELENKSVGLLIGADNHSIFRQLQKKYGRDDELDAIQTALGWTLFGKLATVQEK